MHFIQKRSSPFLEMTIIDSSPLATFGSTSSSSLPFTKSRSLVDLMTALNRSGSVAPEISRPKVAVALPGMSTFSFSSVTSCRIIVSFESMFTAVICKLYRDTLGSAGL